MRLYLIPCDMHLQHVLFALISVPTGVELVSYLICCWGEGSLPKNGLRHPRITEVPPNPVLNHFCQPAYLLPYVQGWVGGHVFFFGASLYMHNIIVSGVVSVPPAAGGTAP